MMPNPSIHFSPLRHKYIFPFFHLLSLFYQGQTWTPWKTHTHTSRAGRSPGPVILHLHLSRLADALIQGDLQRQCNGRAEREWSDVGESRRAEGGDVRFICIYYNLGSWFGDLLIPEIHLSKILISDGCDKFRTTHAFVCATPPPLLTSMLNVLWKSSPFTQRSLFWESAPGHLNYLKVQGSASLAGCKDQNCFITPVKWKYAYIIQLNPRKIRCFPFPFSKC